MATRTKGMADSGTRRTTPASARSARSSEPVRVWSECSVTIAVSDNPPQFIKFTHGFEKMSPSDSDIAIRRTEESIYKTCEAVVDRRIKRLNRLMRQIEQEG